MDLKDLRESAGMTAEQIAKKLGLHSQTIYDYERGKRKLPVALVFHYSNILKATVSEINRAMSKTLEATL